MLEGEMIDAEGAWFGLDDALATFFRVVQSVGHTAMLLAMFTGLAGGKP